MVYLRVILQYTLFIRLQVGNMDSHRKEIDLVSGIDRIVKDCGNGALQKNIRELIHRFTFYFRTRVSLYCIILNILTSV